MHKYYTIEFRCPECKHKFTVKDLDSHRPVLTCRKCDRFYGNKVLGTIYMNAVKYGLSEGARINQDKIKDVLGIEK